MKLANKVYFATLLLLTLAFAATAQSNARPDSDPRNTAPTVGTGGPVGGPTGLFTVYDGQVLRRGEYTFSAAYSNYDRDPGNVDITSVPVSFQIGLTDNIELFFNTEAWRGIKVNSPRNLSGFYLPNSQLLINGVYRSGPAIVMAPSGPGVSLYGNSAIFRPTGSQPFISFPYSGGNAGTFGLLPPFFSGPQFGFAAGTNALLGPPRAAGVNSQFPGVGSVFGSILPGVVLTTVGLTNAAGAVAGEAPGVFTLMPSYLPDAPFINRTWGQTAFNSFDVGVKWRLNNVNSAIGYGFMAAYTFNADNANTASGFNQLQRGASAGGNMGDITLAAFADARLATWANLAANVAYKYTSKVTGTFPNGTFTLLDRPDELQSSIGVDFPVNKYFQPIAEFRSLYYIGGRTPNAFPQNPMDAIAGVRVFPVRWAGFGVAYRYNVNQQQDSSFNANTTATANVLIPCRQGVQGCVAQTVSTTINGVPPGFITSTDPHGYIFQAWIGRRNLRAKELINQPPVINGVNLTSNTVTLGCPPGYKSKSGSCSDSRTVGVATDAKDPENDVLTYGYTVSGGRVVGSGANVQWDLTGAGKGTYTIVTSVDDGCGVCAKTVTKTVTVQDCPDCVQVCNCTPVSMIGPSGVTNPGGTMTFTLQGASDNPVNWSVSAGTIESGQGSSSITVRVPSEGVTNVTATAEVAWANKECGCPNTASETGGVAPPVRPESTPMANDKDDEVKARIDLFYAELNKDPNAKGYVVTTGSAVEIKKRKAQIMKAVTFRKYDPNRLVFIDKIGKPRETTLWLVPAGATPPQ